MKEKVTMTTIVQKDIPEGVEIANDMINSVEIRRDRGFILGLTLNFRSGRQPIMNGYNNTDNIGYILLGLAELLGVNTEGESDDLLAAFRNAPCRIASDGKAGDIIAEHTWLGHFMFDRWIRARELVDVGIDKPEDK